MILTPVTVSGSLSASQAISTLPGRLMSITLMPPATGTATLVLYDNASAASGTILDMVYVSATSTQSININCVVGKAYQKGLYASLTGTTSFNVGYQT